VHVRRGVERETPIDCVEDEESFCSSRDKSLLRLGKAYAKSLALDYKPSVPDYRLVFRLRGSLMPPLVTGKLQRAKITLEPFRAVVKVVGRLFLMGCHHYRPIVTGFFNRVSWLILMGCNGCHH
jgi:hypothetical protein